MIDNLVYHMTSNWRATKDPLDKVAQQFSEKLQQKLAEHYQDENLNVVELAKQLAMSHRQFGRKTKSLLDMTPNECIRAYRLQKAAQLLYEGQPPSTTAYNVGFSSHYYFTACFKAKFGCTPSEYVSNGMPKT